MDFAGISDYPDVELFRRVSDETVVAQLARGTALNIRDPGTDQFLSPMSTDGTLVCRNPEPLDRSDQQPMHLAQHSEQIMLNQAALAKLSRNIHKSNRLHL